jgi:hypothetical protein
MEANIDRLEMSDEDVEVIRGLPKTLSDRRAMRFSDLTHTWRDFF